MREIEDHHRRNRRRLLLIAVLTLVVAALLAAGTVTARGAGESHLAFEFTITAGEGPGAAYTCDALVKDAASGNILAAPRLVASNGDEASAESTLASGESVQLKVVLDAEGKKATATAIVLRAEKIVRSQTVTLTISG